MEAACTAAEVGCTAFLIEKADHLGGLAYEISKFPDKSRLRDFPDYLERRIKKLHNLHVFLNTEVTRQFSALSTIWTTILRTAQARRSLLSAPAP